MGKYLEWSQQFRSQINSAGEMLTDEQAIEVAAIFMQWDSVGSYKEGERVRYGDMLYKCLQTHKAQADWAPNVSPSLWVRIDNPAIEYPDWIQPLGAHDAYPIGAKVTHKGKKWTSTTDANVWEPGVYGWEEKK